MLRVFAAAVGPSRTVDEVVEVITPEGPLPKMRPEHAFDGKATLCGILRGELTVMDRRWSPRTKPSCSVCLAMFETTDATSGIPDDYPYGTAPVGT
jgi:hypothetical protein